MHGQRNIKSQFFLSSTCFEYLMFIIRRTILYTQPYMLLFHALMQAFYQVERRIEHILCWLTLRHCITMHGTKNVAFSSGMLGSLSWWLVKLGWLDR